MQKNTMVKLPLLGLALAVSLPVGSAFAHHSAAMFDQEKVVTLTGYVKQYDFSNPHCWIIFTVQNPNGIQEPWAAEGYTPNSMKRWGLEPSTVKPGDKITISLHPLRDGQHGGSLISAILASGKFVDATSAEQNQQNQR
jgi:hypothetical protein